jgi:inosose dehydratase
MKLAGAPITWGVCEVPGWGTQLDAPRVLEEVASLGLAAVELGPPGFLAGDGARVRSMLAGHGLRLAGGFVTAVLHRTEHRERALAEIERQATMLAAAGADVLVLAAALGDDGYDRSAELSEPEWLALLEGLDDARLIGARHRLATVLHPHFGTAVEREHQVARIVNRSDIELCIDTGHLMVGGVNPVDVVRSAGARVTHVHLKDVDAGLAARVRSGELGYRDAVMRGMYRPLGDGDVDLLAVLELLTARGYAGWYVLEQDVVLDGEPAPDNGPVTSAARSIDFLTRILPQ